MSDPSRQPELSRRTLLRNAGVGLGAIALSCLLGEEQARSEATERRSLWSPQPPHFAPKAKHVIFLTMAGGPSHIDLFDPKPVVIARNGQPIPPSFMEGERFAQLNNSVALLGSPHKFARYGQSGADFSAILPQMASIADEWTILRGLNTDSVNHDPAMSQLNTGSTQIGRPSFGAWTTYGLGSECQDLPAYVVMNSGKGQSLLPHNWSAGFLPGIHQGVQLRGNGPPVLFLEDPKWLARETRRKALDTLEQLNRLEQARSGDAEIETRIEAFEMAYRMQTSVPELVDLASETQETLDLYGIDRSGKALHASPDDFGPGREDSANFQAAFARNCLLARRLVERGVRFVQLFHRDWDHHGAPGTGRIDIELPALCREVDRATRALVLDLKRRGLLDDTILIWGGEFGRTPMRQVDDATIGLGRDHHRRAFTMLFAGGGFRPGLTFGQTDDFGFHVVEGKRHVHDLQATLLHLLGIDHTRLTFRHKGRDYRLTDVAGEVIREVIA